MTSWLVPIETISNITQYSKMAAELNLIGQQVLDFDKVTYNVQAQRYVTMTDTNETTTLFPRGTEHSEPSAVEYDWNNYPLFSQRRHFTLSKVDMAADNLQAQEVQKDLVARTVRKMATVEDKIYLDGYYRVDGTTAVNGLTGITMAAGNTHGAALGWTAGGDPYADFLAALETVDDTFINDNDANWRFIMYPSRLRALQNLDGYGKTTMEHIEHGMKISDSQLFKSSSQTSTTCTMWYKDPKYGKYTRIDGENYDVREPEMSMGGDFAKWYIVSGHGIKIKETNAAYTITGV